MTTRLRLAFATLAACAVAALGGVLIAEARREPAATLELGPTGFAGSIRPLGARAGEVTELRDADGERVSMTALRGRPVVVTFVYSTCEDTCPAQVQSIRGALDELGHDVPVVAISVDPAGDTPARARRFVAEQRMTGRMRFLLGDRAALQRVWRAYGIAPQQGDLDHTATVVLVDGKGLQRVSFPYQALTSDGLAHDLARLEAGA